MNTIADISLLRRLYAMIADQYLRFELQSALLTLEGSRTSADRCLNHQGFLKSLCSSVSMITRDSIPLQKSRLFLLLFFHYMLLTGSKK